MMLDGGMHLMGDIQSSKKLSNAFAPARNNQDCVTQVADQCIDLNQFISKMDELVYA